MSEINSIKKSLNYNPETGIFTWKLDKNQFAKKGSIAGCYDKDGYLIIKCGKTYKAHRLAWLYTYGEWPKGQIDHINGVRDDNRIENLREVTNRQNCQNWGIHREGSLVGAQYHKASRKWRSRIYYKGINYYLGLYITKEEAYNAYNNKLSELLNNELDSHI